jgi:hypothetical protein
MRARQTEPAQLRTPRLFKKVVSIPLLRPNPREKRTMMSFSGYFWLNSAWKYSIGDFSYGSWSAECCEYLASFSALCFDTVPSHGCSAPVIRCSSVDLPVPFAPRIAMRESMLEEGRMSQREAGVSHGREGTHSIPKEIFS